MNQEAKVTSFVLRFVHEEPPPDTERWEAGWYSVVRHVQSDTERRFTHWDDLVAFIQQYVDLSKGAKDE